MLTFYGVVLIYNHRNPRAFLTTKEIARAGMLERCRQFCLGYGLVPTGHLANDAKAFLREVKPEADRLALLDAYVSLTESVPEMGSAEDWTKKTDAIVIAAAKVAAGRDDAKEALKTATSCAACHKEHKPSN